MSKARDLFPSLTEEDLKPYLLRSRATNTYDAVTLLARSVGVAFEQAGGDNCNNVNVIQIAFEKVFMVSLNNVQPEHASTRMVPAPRSGSEVMWILFTTLISYDNNIIMHHSCRNVSIVGLILDVFSVKVRPRNARSFVVQNTHQLYFKSLV